MATSERRFAEDAGRACEALVAVLSNDPRVQECASRTFSAEQSLRAVERALARLTHEDLRLPYTWLPNLLTRSYAAWLIGLPGAVEVSPAVQLPGRRAKDGGQHIRRDVEWFYQNRIQNVSTRELARAYQQGHSAPRSDKTDSRSVVQNGIRRVERLLATFREHAI